MKKPREMTHKMFELIDEGVLDRDAVIVACMSYMSEDDVAEMMRINEFVPPDEDEDDK